MSPAISPVMPGRDERGASRRLRPLAGQIAVVTGGGRGLGAAIATRLAEDGANLVLAARTVQELNHVAGQARAHGVEVAICGCDVTDPAQVRQLFSALPEGRLEVLVNCAGTNKPEPFLQVAPATFDLIMGVNLRGAFLASQAAAEHMIRQGTGGSIVNVTSQMGHVGAAERSVYCASKHALEGLTKALAVELAPYAIRVNSVAPTFIDTAMTRGYMTPGFRAAALAEIPLGRFGTADEVADAVAFLAGPGSSLITGTSLLADGGWTAH
jgi:NAD(P)-dependent dehydrogenase (short-subunit alcohol dehydrogenase family)